MVVFAAGLVVTYLQIRECGPSVPSQVDLGTVAPGKVAGIVPITNQGWQPLRILSLESNCGCTVVDVEAPLIVLPWSRLDINFELDTTNMAGPATKYLYVRLANQSEKQAIAIHADVDRKLAARLIPATVDFGTFGSWDRPSLKVRVDYSGSREYQFEIPNPEEGFEFRKTSPVTFDVDITNSLPDGEFNRKFALAGPNGQLILETRGNQKSQPYCGDSLLVLRPQARDMLRHSITIQHPSNYNLDLVHVSTPWGQARIDQVEAISPVESRICFAIECNGTLEDHPHGQLEVQLSASEPSVDFSVPFVLATRKNKE